MQSPQARCSGDFDEVWSGSIIRQGCRVESSTSLHSAQSRAFSGMAEMTAHGCLIAGLQCPDAAVFLTSASAREGGSQHSLASGVAQSCCQQEGLKIWSDFSKLFTNGTAHAAASWMPISFETLAEHIHNRD